jgi:hypothetical protein
MMITLVPLCSAELVVRAPLDAGGGVSGRRMIAEIEWAKLTGERLSGRNEGSASADWATLTSTGLVMPDVRLAIRTDDDALLLMRYTGRLKLSPDVPSIAWVSATFDSGDERYTWLTEAQIVGRGEMGPDFTRLDYEFYELA